MDMPALEERPLVSQPQKAKQRISGSGLLPALGLALLIVMVEYLARHYVMFWFPVLGAYRVNDMLSAGVFYIALVLVLAAIMQRNIARVGEGIASIFANLRDWQVWVLPFTALGVMSILHFFDQLLWSSVTLPFLLSPWQVQVILLPDAAPVLVWVSLLVFNGVVIPFAEEWLWRGLIQPRMIGVLGPRTGWVLTSILFSLKHAIIDGSLGRLLALVGFGLVMGWIAREHGWRKSAMTHSLANIVASIITLLEVGWQNA